ncbi:MAG: NUDIX domain-containing protein [Tissierellia bacterium]|nr:NUDIX domain-containing protein [Tissierellia bacterium]
MQTVLMNMCMIYDKKTKKVVVLDKKKKYGWEGLTFPGGHLEDNEGLFDSVRREVMEETGLSIGKLKLMGVIHWFSEDISLRQSGFLFYTEEFSGQLLDIVDEGRLSWMDYQEFLMLENKSDSMDDILKVYNGEYMEVLSYYGEDGHIRTIYR